jgi:tetratricopeptide (TPR) repeat protein
MGKENAMLEVHPSAADFAGFLQGAGGPEHADRNLRILRHLLAECRTCKERLRSLGWPEHGFERLFFEGNGEDSEERPQGYSYDVAFHRAEAALEECLAPAPPPIVALDRLIEALLATPPAEREALVLSDTVFAVPQLVDWLIEKSHETRYADPADMLLCARIARTLACRCALDSVGSPARSEDLRARAWRQYANALRVAGQFRESEEAFKVAQHHLAEGTGDPLLEALQAEHLASLYTNQRRFPEAIRETEEAAAIYRELGESHALARVIVKEAIAFLYSGDPEGAVRRLNLAIPMIDQEEDPHLLLAACHNLVCCYVDLDRPECALALYLESRELYQEFSDPLIQLRYSWREGVILRDLGQLRGAETTLQHTRAGFLEKGLTVEAAEVSLDLAAVYVKLKAFEDLKETVSATAVIFRALGMDRDALASLLQLQQVAHEEHRALDLVRSLAAQLEAVAKRAPARL